MASTHHMPAPNTLPDMVHAAVNHVWGKIRHESAEEIKAAQEKAHVK